MTDNEIIKGLEICGGYGNYPDCEDCPYYDNRNCRYGKSLIKDALDLINRQKAEIENYSHNNRTMTNSIYEMQKIIESQKAEIERLKDVLTDNEYANCVAVKNGLIYTYTLDDYDRLIGDISAEAIKEFAERLKEKANKSTWISGGELLAKDYTISSEILDNLVKEMVGDADGKANS